jgi:hypothetical protein
MARSHQPACLPAAQGSFQIVLEQAPMESFQIELSLVDKAGVSQDALTPPPRLKTPD